jgi:kynurenine formamidase
VSATAHSGGNASFTPAADRWWPSAFGAEDEIGMLNHIDDAKRVAAMSLVREGRIYDLGRPLDERLPVLPGRYFRQTLVTTAHHANPDGEIGDNDVNWVIEQVATTMVLGTHIDALSHLQIGARGYNGWTVEELAGLVGVKRLGAETIRQIVTRGWLLDVPAIRRVERLHQGEVITIADIEQAEVSAQPGDAVLFHTGWGEHWKDPAAYMDGEPGPGCEVAGWLVDHGVSLTGCDTWSYGPLPPENPDRPFEVPQILNVHHGMFVVENLETRELAADRCKSFALILTHPKPRGATGAWTSPVALV